MLKFYRFDEIVTKSLLLHLGEIESFRVRIPYHISLVLPDMNKWILYLSWRKIKKLTLTHKYVTYRHKLPPYFFSCLDLTYLKLHNFVLSAPLEFKGFLNLYRLLLKGVEFTDNCFERVISSCPVLKTLSLHRCFGIHHFNITGSNLKRFLIKDDEKFKSISLENASNLSEVSVSLERVVTGREGKPVSDLGTLVDTLPKVKILRLNGMFLQLLDETPVLPMLSPSS
ncbi:F-box/FBD/LRR-repeat protein At1g13570-like [Nicotiana sylvestris]|uniref:F-box/FBD/LRR-repeat protein At1g13570-like n=1 Tax=Nicotiana sylvestris TaxID=4096 RepID=UPI00388CC816